MVYQVRARRRLILATGRLVWDRRLDRRYHWINDRRQDRAVYEFLNYLRRSGHDWTLIVIATIPIVMIWINIFVQDPATRAGMVMLHIFGTVLYLMTDLYFGVLRRVLRAA